MSPNIRVDQDVYDFLKKHAEAFVDSPNSVLRRLLNLTPGSAAQDPSPSAVKQQTKPKVTIRRPSRNRKRKSSPRIARGRLLPVQEYVRPLLSSLEGRGGSGPAREVIEDVGRSLDGKLTEHDKANLPSGGIRWQNRVQFLRLKLTEEGLLAKGSPRGLWELTDAGREKLSEGDYRGS